MCDNITTSEFEAISRHWKNIRTHIRFLSKQILMPFLYVRMFFLNIRAHLKDACPTTVEDREVYSFINKTV